MVKIAERVVAFSGTQQGMNLRQIMFVRMNLEEGDVIELHHGDCKGADEQVHKIAMDLGLTIIVHPPEDPKKRAWCGIKEGTTGQNVVVLDAKPYLDRNHDMVDQSKELLAAPATKEEVLRSGAWATIRYAEKRKKPVTKIHRD